MLPGPVYCLGVFEHHLDPVLGRVGPVAFYWYGLAYAVGFLGIWGWLRAWRRRLGWPLEDCYDLVIVFAVGVLLLGRAFDVLVYEWPYYSRHPGQILDYARGGMATHGVILGGLLGIAVFAWARRRSFRLLADWLAIPAALFLGLARVGNFINGQIYGTVSSVWWAVKFPGVEGYRHPVTLYDGVKNLLLVPLLLVVFRRAGPGRGLVAAHFLFWYGLPRLLIDHFRVSVTDAWGISPEQYANAATALVGAGLMVYCRRGAGGPARTGASGATATVPVRAASPGGTQGQALGWALWVRRGILAALVFLCLTISSDWTQGARDEILRPAAPAPP